MIEVKLYGRLGNNLFQYFLGRILCDLLNEGITLKNNLYKLPEIPPNGKIQDSVIQLDGYFHQQVYYSIYRNKIKEWSKFLFTDSRKPEKEAIVLHIRSGDLYQKWRPITKVHPQHIPCYYSYYADILKGRTEKIYAVCERTDDPVLLKLKENFDIEVVSGDVMEDFYFLASANKIIISVSTFAWWGAFLSSADEIHFPVLGFFDNKVLPECDYVVNGWITHQLENIDNWESSEEQVNKILNYTHGN